MLLSHRLRAYSVLLAFVAGGLVGPAVHQVEHALGDERVRQEGAAHPDHVHAAGGVAFTVPLDGIPSDHALCLLCAPEEGGSVLVSAGPPLVGDTKPFAPQRPAAPGAALLERLSIRGPPVVA